MSRAYSLLGRWRGGPYNSKVMIFYEDDGTAAATFKCPSGAEGKVAGIFMEGCRRLRGRFYDPDAGGGPGKMERIDLVLEADGKSWHTEGGASWNGRRYSWRSSKDLPPPETNEKWERLQKRVDLDERTARLRKQWESTYDPGVSNKHAQAHGLMGQVAPMCIGDPYVAHPKTDPRLLGRNLVCTTSKSGKVGEGTTFSQVQPNCVGDPYLGADERAQKDRQRQRDALRDKAPFKPAGQTIVGRRDKFLLDMDSDTPAAEVAARKQAARDAKRAKKAKEVVVAPRNVYTTAKVGEMLGPQTEEGRKMYEYHPSDYNIPNEIRMKEIEVWHEKLGDKPAFRRAVPGGQKFSQDPEMYYGMGPGAPVKPPLRTERKLPEDKPAFFPTTVTKSDREASCFAKFSPYMPDPLPETQYTVKDTDKPSFKPTSYAKTTLSKSVTLNKTNLRARMTAAGSRVKI